MTDLRAPGTPDASGPVVAPDRPVRLPWVLAAVVVVVLGAGAAWFVAGRGGGGAPHITATDAAVGASGDTVAAAYLRLTNSGSGDDRLVRVSSPDVADVTMHTTRTEGGLSTMESADSIDLPAGETVSLSPGGSHLMLEGASSPATAGRTVHLHLEFQRAPAIDVDARVVPLADLADRMGR